MSTSSMKTFIQTRGINIDYQFLGASPPSAWWLDFRDATSFEQPTLIIKGDKRAWRCYLSGITSSRTDRVGTTIRYSLVLEGICANTADNAAVLNVISAWLEDAPLSGTAKTHQRTLGEALDRVLEESYVEDMLRAVGQDSMDDVLSKLVLKPAAELQVKPWDGSWVGSMSSKPAQKAFMQRIADILAGTQDGFAAWLNLLGNTDEVTALAQIHAGEYAVLIDVAADAFADDDHRLEIKKSSATPPSVKTSVENAPSSACTTGETYAQQGSPPAQSFAPSTGGNPTKVFAIAAAVLLLFVLYLLTQKQETQQPPDENKSSPTSQNSTKQN